MTTSGVLNEKGVTMVELIIVVTIVAILAVLMAVGPAYLSGERISGYTRELLSDIQLARNNAMTMTPDSAATSSRGYGLRFVSGTSYVMFEFDDCNESGWYEDNGCSGGREEINPVNRQLAKDSDSYKMLTNLGATEYHEISDDVVIYDHTGIPRRPNWAVEFGTIRIAHKTDAEVDEKCVSISINRIREGVWNEETSSCDEK